MNAEQPLTDAADESGEWRILIVDDHPSVRHGIASHLARQPDMGVCGEANSREQALEQVASLRPDVVLVDLRLGDSSGLGLIADIAKLYPEVHTCVHSMYEESLYAERCLEAGARGYITKDTPPHQLVEALRTVLAGRIALSPAMTSQLLTRQMGRKATPSRDPIARLSPRQLEVFQMLGEGKTVAEIARRLKLSVHTVETHRENIKRKLDVPHSAELARRAALWVADRG